MSSCPVCGGDLTDPAHFCNHAGREPVAEPAPLFSNTPDSDQHLRGIGGWLILVAIGLVVGPLLLLAAIAKNAAFLAAPGRVRAEEILPGLSFLVTVQAVTNAAMLLTGLGLLVLFFRRKRSFPRLYQVWLAAFFVIALVQLTFCPHSAAIGVDNPAILAALARIHTTLVRTALESFLSAAIWISYFAVSRRVRVTFVN